MLQPGTSVCFNGILLHVETFLAFDLKVIRVRGYFFTKGSENSSTFSLPLLNHALICLPHKILVKYIVVIRWQKKKRTTDVKHFYQLICTFTKVPYLLDKCCQFCKNIYAPRFMTGSFK